MADVVIKLTQGATTDLAGRAVEGVLTTPVVASAVVIPAVTSYAWYLVDAPAGTGLSLTDVDEDLDPIGSPASTTSTFTFAPDVRGTYQVLLIINGIRALFDVRDFVVAEASGDRIPALRSDPFTYNLGGDPRALRRDVNAILRKAAAGSSSLTVVRNATAGTVAAAAKTRIYHKATGAVTYQLPASPADKDVVEIERRAVGTGSISIDGNGHNVDVGTGAGASYGPSTTLLFASLQYDATDGVWSA